MFTICAPFCAAHSIPERMESLSWWSSQIFGMPAAVAPAAPGRALPAAALCSAANAGACPPFCCRTASMPSDDSVRSTDNPATAIWLFIPGELSTPVKISGR